MIKLSFKTWPLLPMILLTYSIAPLASHAAKSKFKFPESKDSQTFIKELIDDLRKTDSALNAVKRRMENLSDRSRRADLLMQQAELHIEKSRYHYFIAREKNPNGVKSFKDVEAAAAEKGLAISTYQKVLQEFPNNFNKDKILFFMAQEMEQVGDRDAAMDQYEKIVRQFKDSEFTDDALIILGNKDFDERKFDEAAERYQAILDLSESPSHNIARYKLAWVKVNQDKCKHAVRLFRDVAVNANKASSDDPQNNANNSIQREALIDSVLCYTKVYKKAPSTKTIEFYKKHSDSNQTYIAILDKLANRFYIQKQLKQAIPIYRELIRRSYDLELRVDYLQRLFGNLRKVGYKGPIDEDSKILVDSLRRYFYSWRQEQSDRLDVANTLEKYLRDAATRLHMQARKSKDPDDQKKAAITYKNYLLAFADHPNANKMKLNGAEALFEAKDFIKAGEEYAMLAQKVRKTKHKADLFHSSTAAYLDALKQKDQLSKLELLQAQSGFVRASEAYLKINPRSKRALNIRYAIGKVYFDQNDLDQTISYYKKFVYAYPNTHKTVDAITLLLEAYHLKSDTKGMIAAGNELIRSRRFNSKVVSEIKDLVSRAEFKNLEESYAQSASSGQSQDLAAGFFKLSAKYKGTEAGEKAVYNGYVSAKKTNKPDQMMAAAEMLMRDYPKSKYLGDILPNMSQTMFQVGLFDLGAKASEIYALNFKQKQSSVDSLVNAAKIRSALSDHGKALRNFKLATKLSKSNAKKQSVLLTAAKSFDEHRNWKYLNSLSRYWLSQQSTSSQAYFYMAKSLFKQNQFARAFSAAKKSRLNIGNAGSQRSFIQAQLNLLEAKPIFSKYKKIKLRSGQNEEAQITKKTQLLELLSQKYTQVAQSGESTSSIAALAQSGHLYKDFTSFLSKTGIPRNLNAAQKQQYRQIMQAKINEVKQTSLSLYQACHSKAEQIKLFTLEALECAQKKQVRPSGLPMRNSMRSFQNELQSNVKVLMKNPKDTDTLLKNAKLFLDNRWNYSAILSVNRVHEVDKNNDESYSILGKALQNLNNDDEAYKNFTKALKINSSNTAARVHRKRLCSKYKYKSCAR